MNQKLVSALMWMTVVLQYMFLLSLTIIIAFMVKVDKVYLSTPTKIAILDHERKRTFVLRKDGLPDAGELAMTVVHLPFSFLFLC